MHRRERRGLPGHGLEARARPGGRASRSRRRPGPRRTAAAARNGVSSGWYTRSTAHCPAPGGSRGRASPAMPSGVAFTTTSKSALATASGVALDTPATRCAALAAASGRRAATVTSPPARPSASTAARRRAAGTEHEHRAAGHVEPGVGQAPYQALAVGRVAEQRAVGPAGRPCSRPRARSRPRRQLVAGPVAASALCGIVTLSPAIPSTGIARTASAPWPSGTSSATNTQSRPVGRVGRVVDRGRARVPHRITDHRGEPRRARRSDVHRSPLRRASATFCWCSS